MAQYEAATAVAAAQVNRGAKRQGVDLKEYLRLRREAVQMYSTGHTSDEIAEALKIDRKQADNWRTRARLAGLLPPPHPKGTQPPNLAGAATKVGAERMGVSVEEYTRRRSTALAMLEAGKSPVDVARELGVDRVKVANWKTWATPQGNARKKHG